MKTKLTLLLFALLCSMGAWAESVTVNSSSGTFYKQHKAAAGDSWNNYWESTSTTPQVIVKTNHGGNSGVGNIFGPANQSKDAVTYTADIRSGYGYSFFVSSTHIITKVAIQAWAQGGANKITDNTSGREYPFNSGDVKTIEIACNAQEVINAFNVQNNTALYANVIVYYESISPVSTPFCTYGPTTGTFYSGTTDKTKQNSYADKWVSTQTSPQVTISVSGNNLTCPGRTGSSEGASCFFANGGKTYTISVPNSAMIKGYTLVGRSYTSEGAAGNNITATTTESVTQTFTASEDKKLEVTGKDLRSTSFTLTGSNAFLRPTSFLIYAENDPTFVANKAGLSNTKSYMVHGARGDWQYASSEATSLSKTTIFSRTDDTRQIAFIKSATTGNYYAYSVITGKFITSSNTLSATPEPIYIFETGNENYPFYFSFMSDKSDKNINLSTDFEFNYYNTYDAGNQWCLYAAKDFDIPSAISTAISDFETTHVTVTYKLTYNETILAELDVTHDVGAATVSPWATPAFCSMAVSPATVTAETTEVNVTMTSDLPFSISSTYDDANWYYLKLRGKYAIYGDTAPYSLTDSKSTALAAREKSLWAFVGNPFDGFRVVNKEAGARKYLDSYDATIQMGSTADGYSLWTVGEAGSDFTLHCGAKYLNDADEAGKMASKNNAGSDAGSVMAVEDVDYYNLSIALITELNSAYAITEDQCFGIRPSEKSAMEELLSEAFSANHSLLTSTVYDNTVKPAIIALLYPKAGRYYLIKNNYNNKYMHVTASGTRGAVLCDLTAEEAAKDVSAHFYITEKDSKPYLTTQGEYLNWVWGQTDGYEGVTATKFDKYVHWAIPTPGVGAFSIAYGNGEGDFSGYLGNGYYALKGAESTVVAGSTTNETSNLAQWTFEEVTTLDISLNVVGSKSYATFCAPFDVTIGSGAIAYQVDLDVERNKAVYSAITDNKVPAGAGVLIISDDAETSVTATIRTSGDAFSALVGNDLVGYKFAQTFSYPDATTNWNLVLGNSATTGIGFYKMNGTASPNKAYLPYPHEKSSLVKGIILVPEDEEETSIRSIDNAQLPNNNAAIYNLSGQRLGRLRKGLNIVDGKKVVVE